MGFIPNDTGSTVYAVAYLTETGRNYLFDKNNTRFDTNGNDLFAITSFALSDCDTNYQVQNPLSFGDVPDVSGTGAQCLKTADNNPPAILLYYQVDAMSFIVASYSTSLANTSETETVSTDIAFPVNISSDVPPNPPSVNTNTAPNQFTA